MGRSYGLVMLARVATLTVLVAGLSAARAEVVLLKDKATVIGKILAQKKVLVVVDLGYTVLAIPRSQIVRVVKEGDRESKDPKGKPAPAAAVSPAPEAQDPSDLYTPAKASTPEKSVRE